MLRAGRESNGEADPARNHAELSRLHKQQSEFRLNVQGSELWNDEEVPICVTEGSVIHVLVDHVDILRDTLTYIRIAAPSNTVEAVHKVDLRVRSGQLKWTPFDSRGDRLDPRVQGEKRALNVSFTLKSGVEFS